MDSHWNSANSIEHYQDRGPHSGGAIGPLFVVLAIITILGVIAGMIGRVCNGRHWGGDTEYDFEGWVERRCASCIDGDIEMGAPVEDAKPAEPPPAEAAPPPPAEAAPPPAEEAKPPEGGGEEKPAEGGGEAAAAAAPAEEAKPAEGGGEGGG